MADECAVLFLDEVMACNDIQSLLDIAKDVPRKYLDTIS